MNVKLYATDNEVNAISKSLINRAEVNAIIKGAISLENPVLILDYKNSLQAGVNYMYIPEYKRYYYINDVIDLTGGRCEVHAHVDVLMSFKERILALNCIINKQRDENNSNKYFDDGSFVVQSKEFIQTINFPNGFNDDGEFILITAGGGVTV